MMSAWSLLCFVEFDNLFLWMLIDLILGIVIPKMKPKHFPFCVVKPLTDEVSTSEQKMNPKREHFSC